MVTKHFKIDFFRVTMPDGCMVAFHTTFQAILHKPVGVARNHVVNEAPIRIQQGVAKGDFCEGDMIRIQMDGLPLKAGLDGSAAPVEFKDDEGLGHESAFLYYPPLKILLLQRNRSGPSAESVARYFEAHGETDGPIHLEPIPMPNLAARLNKMTKVRKLKIRVAGLARAKQFQPQNPSVQKMIGLINDMQGMVLELELNAGLKRSDSIDRVGVMGTVTGLLGLPADVADVQRIDVSGRDEEDTKVDTLHLLDFCMTEKGVSRSVDRRFPYDSRAAALRKAWNARRESLNTMFSPLAQAGT